MAVKMKKQIEKYNSPLMALINMSKESANGEEPAVIDIDDVSPEQMAKVKKMVSDDLAAAIRTARTVLSNDMVYFIRKQGFFAHISVDMQKNITTEVPYAAVNIIRGVSNLYINPNSYPELPKNERVGILMHEVLHLILYHVLRREEKNHYHWNLATDTAINQMIPRTSEISLPDWVYMPESFRKMGIDCPDNLSADEYYIIIRNNKDKVPEDLNGGSGGSGSPGDNDGQGNGKAQDWHAKWSETEGNEKVNEAAIKKAVKEAYGKHAGSIPGNLRPMIEEIIASKINWQAKLRMFSAKYIQSNVISTYKRENRRLGSMAKGRRKTKKLHLAVFVDTSASVSDDNLAQFTGEIKAIWNTGAKVTVYECDVMVHNVYEFKGKIERLEYEGRGGTSFIPPFEKLKEDKMDVDAILYLTDGFGTAPDKFHIPTLWVLTPNGVKPSAASGGTVNWGDTVQIN